jgi:hypothetical protein
VERVSIDLDVDEPVPVEEACRRRHSMAHPQIVLHERPTQIDHAVLEPDRLDR